MNITSPRYLILASMPGLFLVVAVVAAGFGPTAAHAESADPPAPIVTWSASPASESGPDGRAWMELEADPGEKISEHLAVRNLSDMEVTFTLSSADGYFTPTGRFNMLPLTAKSVGAGTWIDVQDTVTVPPESTAVVPVTITVPEKATPGDHAAGLAASIFSAGSGDGASVGVESRVGFRVMTRVSGDVAANLAVTKADGTYHVSWNPFKPGSVTVDYELENTGNVRVSVAGRTTAGGGTVAELLPGDRRDFQLESANVWPLGRLSVPLVIDQAMITLDGEAETLTPLEQNIIVWAIPWPQVIGLLALVLIVGGLLVGRRRRQKHIRILVQKARDEGAREGVRLSHLDASAHSIPEKS